MHIRHKRNKINKSTGLVDFQFGQTASGKQPKLIRYNSQTGITEITEIRNSAHVLHVGKKTHETDNLRIYAIGVLPVPTRNMRHKLSRLLASGMRIQPRNRTVLLVQARWDSQRILEESWLHS